MRNGPQPQENYNCEFPRLSVLQPVRQNLEKVLSNVEVGSIVVLVRVFREPKQIQRFRDCVIPDRGEDRELFQGCRTVEISLAEL